MNSALFSIIVPTLLFELAKQKALLK